MTFSFDSPQFIIYAFSVAVLAIKMVLVSLRVTTTRFKYKCFAQAVDYGKKTWKDMSEKSADNRKKGLPHVELAYRLHTQCMETEYLYAMIGCVWIVVVDPSVFWTKIFCLGTVLFRILHNLCFIMEIQPWRLIMHLCGYSLTNIMIIQTLLYSFPVVMKALL